MAALYNMPGLPNFNESLSGNLNDYVMSLLGQAHVLASEYPVKGPDNQYGSFFNQQPSWLLKWLKHPIENLGVAIYKATNHEANCIIPYSFGGITLKWPAWRYSNQDNEMTSKSGVGVLSFEVFRDATASHHLYRDLGTNSYFYIWRNGHHNPHTGLESDKRLHAYPYSIIPNRAYEDAVIGSNDKWVKENDKGGSEAGLLNTAIIGVPNPHLSKEAFMNIVYPSYDNPCSRATLENSSESPIVNELVDETKYTPEQDFDSELSDAKLPSGIDSVIKKQFSSNRDIAKQTLGRDEQPLDPNFHIFRMVNMEAIRTHPDMAAANIIGMSGGKYGHLQAWKLIKAYLSNGQMYSDGVGGGMTSSQYYSVLSNVNPNANFPKGTPDYVGLSIATGKSSFASTPMTKLRSLAPFQQNLTGYMYARQYYYETLLFDYYADNSKFFNGKFDVTGRTGIEYGVRLVWHDTRHNYWWEGYIDGVEHHFYYNSNQPWTTTIDVERMLPFTPEEAEGDWRDTTTGKRIEKNPVYQNGQGEYKELNRYGDYVPDKSLYIHGNFSKRFSGGFWGRQARFNGGFFGEQTLASMIDQANEREKAYMSHFLGNSSGVSGANPSQAASKSGTLSDLISYAESQVGKHPYSESNRMDIFRKHGKKGSEADCSSFIAWCCHACGYKTGGDEFHERSNQLKYTHRVSKRTAIAGCLGAGEDLHKDSAHMVIIMEKYHGSDTKIIEEGQTSKDPAGNPPHHNVNYGRLGDCLGSDSYPMRDWVFLKPDKK